ncbi:MAG: Bax inhibitor-1/YccA family protein [Bacteroidales bacterium]|nr:Bax inhibitor-1/YccA family protein [Bacteroidales bacterium]
MAIYKSRNPALDKDIFKEFGKGELREKPMTIEGTINKIVLLLMIVLTSAYFTWNLLLKSLTFENFRATLLISAGWGFLFGLVVILNKKKASIFAPIYCIFEGVALGTLSVIAEQVFPGIIIQAISLTFSVFIVLLIIYKLRIIRVDKNFTLIITSITTGVALFYLISFAFNRMGIVLPYLHENSLGGIIFSVFVVILASLNLVIDFDFIEQGVDMRIPKYMEWYCAFGLMVTLIWLYLEILNLLMKLRKK